MPVRDVVTCGLVVTSTTGPEALAVGGVEVTFVVVASTAMRNAAKPTSNAERSILELLAHGVVREDSSYRPS